MASNTTVVGEDEADVSSGKISILAPISRAMLGKVVGDYVVIKTRHEVLRVEYKAIP